MRAFWICVISTLIVCSSPVQADHASITMGIFPYVSTSKLIAHQKNLLKHVHDVSDNSISTITAKDVSTYVQNLKEYQYDLIYSAPHLARFAEKNYGYQRVVMTTHKIGGVFLVRKESPYQSIAELKDTTVSMAPEQTILHQIAVLQLRKQGLIDGKNLRIKIVKTHNNAIYDVLNKDSDAVVTGIKLWENLRPEDRNKLRQLALTDATTGFIILARPDLDKARIKELQQSFLSFNDTPESKAYIFKGFKLIDDQEMESLDFHAEAFEK